MIASLFQLPGGIRKSPQGYANAAFMEVARILLNEAVNAFLEYLVSRNRSVKTVLTYKKTLDILADFLSRRYNGLVYIDDVTFEDLQSFLEERELNHLSSYTRRRILYTLRSFFSYPVKLGMMNKNIANSLEPENLCIIEKNILEKTEAERLIAEIHHPIVKCAVKVLYYTGMRISECLELKISDVRMSNGRGYFFIANGKGGRERYIPMNSKLRKDIAAYLACRNVAGADYYLFTLRNQKPVSSVSINREIQKAAALAGIKKKVTAHTFRHTFASRLVREGIDLPTIQKLMGHSSLKSTSVYCHTDLDSMVLAVENILNML